MRLRILDLNTPWFWLTIFWQRVYGEPKFAIALWAPHQFRRWWVYVWMWEITPGNTAMMEAQTVAARPGAAPAGSGDSKTGGAEGGE